MPTRNSIEEIEAYTLTNTPFKLLSKTYLGALTPLNFLCDRGHEFSKRWGNLHQGCGVCSTLARKKTILEIEDWVVANTTFNLLSKTYVHSTAPLIFLCEEGHTFNKSWNHVQQGQGCGLCSSSSKSEVKLGELLAEKFLVKPQHWVPCEGSIRKSGKIRVDFYLPETNTIVEYHGRQHYEWVDHWHRTEQDFQAQQTRDQWLISYCLENSINYLEVSYLDFNYNSSELPNPVKEFYENTRRIR